MQQIHPATQATLLADARNTLGEGATWCDRTHALYWVDIEGAQLWRCRADGSDLTPWAMPERLACFALTDDPDVLLVAATHLAFFNLRSGAFTRIVDVEAELPTRLNDGRCDGSGAFVFGMKDEGSEPPRAVGGFYRLNADLTLERLALPRRRPVECAVGRQAGGALRAGRCRDGSHRGADRAAELHGADGEGRLYVTSARIGLSDDVGRRPACGWRVRCADAARGLPTARFAGTPRG